MTLKIVQMTDKTVKMVLLLVRDYSYGPNTSERGPKKISILRISLTRQINGYVVGCGTNKVLSTSYHFDE